MKEKLANFKANFDNKFEKYKNLFYILTSILLPLFVFLSYLSFYENRAFPKPLEYLYMAEGEVISSTHSSRNSNRGTLTIKLNDGSFEYFNIDKDDKEIYKSLYGKKAKIYASEATLLHKKDVKQIEDENGEILKKYDYDFAIKSTGFFSGTFAFCFNVATFLAFILSFVLYNDIKKQIKSKQGVKND